MLVDTSALIYFLGGVQPYFGVLLPLFQRVQARQTALIVSVVSESELLVRPYQRRDEEAIERIGDLLSEDGIRVVGLERNIARRAAELRAIYGTLRLPDATIIATALETECDLVLGNDEKWLKLRDVPYAHLNDIIRE